MDEWEDLRKRDESVLESFVAETIDRTYSMILGILGNAHEAEDVTQQVYEKAFRALPAYRGDAKPTTWLFRIAVNAARDRIRSVSRKRKREVGNAMIEERSANDDPALEAIERERSAALRLAIDRLPENRRELIVMADIEEMPLGEIAEITGVPEGTVKSRLHRARAELRTEYTRIRGERKGVISE